MENAFEKSADGPGGRAQTRERESPPRLRSPHKSHFSTSETETDGDSGITFIARKPRHQGHSSSASRSSADSGAAMKTAPTDDSISTQAALDPDDQIESTQLTPSATVTEVTKPTGSRLTETELMRRRRLLDSHIFD